MTTTADHHAATSPLTSLDTFVPVRTRRSSVGPWLLLLLLWGLATSLLILGAESATLIAASGH